METPDVKALFAAVVGGARPESAAAVQACCDAFRQPARNVLALPTSLLSRILRSIKSKIPDDRRGAAEEAFMKLVTKDNGSLAQILTIVGYALDDNTIVETINAAVGPLSVPVVRPVFASGAAVPPSAPSLAPALQPGGGSMPSRDAALRAPSLSGFPSTASVPAPSSSSFSRPGAYPSAGLGSATANATANANSTAAAPAPAHAPAAPPRAAYGSAYPSASSVTSTPRSTFSQSGALPSHIPVLGGVGATAAAAAAPSSSAATGASAGAGAASSLRGTAPQPQPQLQSQLQPQLQQQPLVRTAPVAPYTASTYSIPLPASSASGSTSSGVEGALAAASRTLSAATFAIASASAGSSAGSSVPPTPPQQHHQQQHHHHQQRRSPFTGTGSGSRIKQHHQLSPPSSLTDIRTVLDLLLAYAATAAAPTASDSDTGAVVEVDPSVLRYGAVCSIRSSDAGRGYLSFSSSIHMQHGDAAAAAAAAGGGAVTAAVRKQGDSGAAQAVQLCRVMRDGTVVTSSSSASSASSATGPVRCGDVLALRLHNPNNSASSAISGTSPAAYLSPAVVAAEEEVHLPDAVTADAYPVAATTAAATIPSTGGSAGANASALLLPEQRWTVVSADSLLAVLAAIQQRRVSSLPRPYITAGQRVMLLSHPPDAEETEATGTSTATTSVSASAVAAIVRLLALHTGTAFVAPALTAVQPVYIDSLASAVLDADASGAGAGMGAGGVDGGGGEEDGGSPLHLSSALSALVLAPPADALWCFHPLSSTTTTGSDSGDSGAATATADSPYSSSISTAGAGAGDGSQSEEAQCRPLASGTHLLPRQLLPHAYARLLTYPPASSPGSTEEVRAAAVAVAALPPSARETAIVRCVLQVLSGAPTLFIQPVLTSPGEPTAVESGGRAVDWDAACSPTLAGEMLSALSFHIHPAAVAAWDPGTVHLLQRMLPLAATLVRCEWWIARRSRPAHGSVAQAVAAAARTLVREYKGVLVQLEAKATAAAPAATGAGAAAALTLQQLWYFLQPSLRTLLHLDALLHRSPHAIGGALLTSLAESIPATGDEAGRALATFLLERGSQPYLRMLAQWVYMAELRDPHGEFMVAAAAPGAVGGPASLARDYTSRYWEGQYTLVPSLTPPFLAPHAQTILTTGKYLHALRLCEHNAYGYSGSSTTTTSGGGGAHATGGGSGGSAATTATAATASAAAAAAVSAALRSPSKMSSVVGGEADAVTATVTAAAAAAQELAHTAVASTAMAAPPAPPAPRLFIAPFAEPIPFSADPQSYSSILQRASDYASKQLMDRLCATATATSAATAGPQQSAAVARMVVSAQSAASSQLLLADGGAARTDLFGRLASLKTFFLLARGDWLTHFLDLASDELLKEVVPAAVLGLPATTGAAPPALEETRGPPMSLQKMRTFLDLSIRMSLAADDPYRTAYSLTVAPCSVLHHLEALGATTTAATTTPTAAAPPPPSTSAFKALNAITLDYDVGWPVSLVISRQAITKYQMLFRHLLLCRAVERSLCAAWRGHSSCKALGLSDTLLVSHGLRHDMLHFLQNVSYYMSVEVLEPRWHELVASQLRTAVTVDDIIAAHGAFLDTAAAECLLTSPDLLKLLTKLLTLCQLFADQLVRDIDRHRLPEEELDRRTGLNRAGQRERAQREQGVYYDGDDAGDVVPGKRGASRRLSRTSTTSGSGLAAAASATAAAADDPTLSKAGAAAAAERRRRKQRLEVQTDVMRHTMSQADWQGVLLRMRGMWDSMLADFLRLLAERTRLDRGSHLAHLLQRLDFNGHYAAAMGLEPV